MSAVDGVLSVTVGASQQDIPELAATHDIVERYVTSVGEQLHNCKSRVTELVATLSACTDAAEMLANKAKELEAVFRKIDKLEASMDVVYQRVLLLNKMVKAIEAPTDVKERAANFFMSFGFRTKALEDHGSSKHAWNRVPNYLMIDGMTANDFVVAMRKEIEILVADSEA
ncbi:Hypothetical protein, putative [Bodo saltans]|uniref:Uncharacterized protein n=1 Tax=Bodo saltans TaxID=75058 RepID=A0A0S4JHK8_BODSA|nr:Hypothetical protein, putative [Bodo saltans]|eukprot:CUG87870.1 Hypothetical protein, putative [Bodo saltans]